MYLPDLAVVLELQTRSVEREGRVRDIEIWFEIPFDRWDGDDWFIFHSFLLFSFIVTGKARSGIIVILIRSRFGFEVWFKVNA